MTDEVFSRLPSVTMTNVISINTQVKELEVFTKSEALKKLMNGEIFVYNGFRFLHIKGSKPFKSPFDLSHSEEIVEDEPNVRLND